VRELREQTISVGGIPAVVEERSVKARRNASAPRSNGCVIAGGPDSGAGPVTWSSLDVRRVSGITGGAIA